MRRPMLAVSRMTVIRIAAIGALLGTIAALPASAQENMDPPKQTWSFEGPFGTYDKASAQRGFQVYKEVCSACHSMKQVYYRNLAGIGLSPEQIKAVAASVTVPTIGDDGQPAERPGEPSDHFKSPYPNEKAARAAQNGALPPDQSVLIKAREDGPNYIYALLTGYDTPPAGMKMGDGMNYNRWFPGHQIAMAPPLTEGRVEYADGTKPTLEQEARDITTFLAYVANPEMEERKRMGVRVVLFLAMLTCLTYAVKRQIWSDVHH
jgi:ubiquinol-cytochrome c reductase cytochrome c1 subunit